jgi:hypothetical protein
VVEATLKINGFLDDFGEYHEEALSKQELDEVAQIEEDAEHFNPPSYADNRVASLFQKISDEKKAEGERSRNFGIGLFMAAATVLAVSMIFS